MTRPGRALTYVSCNHCGSGVTRGVHNISRLVSCIECGLIFVNPRPDFDGLAPQYERDYFHCDQPTFGGYEDYDGDREDILRTFRRRIGFLRPVIAPGLPRILDVGCATGLFMEVAREIGWEVEGVDISGYAVGECRRKGLTVRQGQLHEVCWSDASFDAVTLWDIVEHVPDPMGFLRECHRILRPGGVVAISTPDAGSIPAMVLRGNWLGFRSLDEHLTFFSRRTMTAMLVRAGFRVHAVFAVGKVLSLARLIARLRYYTRIGAFLLRSVDRLVPRLSFYINPLDTMGVVAVRDEVDVAGPP